MKHSASLTLASHTVETVTCSKGARSPPIRAHICRDKQGLAYPILQASKDFVPPLAGVGGSRIETNLHLERGSHRFVSGQMGGPETARCPTKTCNLFFHVEDLELSHPIWIFQDRLWKVQYLRTSVLRAQQSDVFQRVVIDPNRFELVAHVEKNSLCLGGHLRGLRRWGHHSPLPH